eukprot:gene7318-9755_t
MAMLFTGKHVTAAQALDMGLLNEVVPRAELDGAVARWVEDILACAPLSLQAIKQVVRSTGQLTPVQAQSMRLPALVAALNSDDGNEGVLAFQQKRKPSARVAYVIVDTCIDCKDASCVTCCPVDCIYEGP